MNKMWMMGYNDGGGDFNLGDSFAGAGAARKLRPLIPRPAPLPSTSATFNNNNISTMSDLQCLSGFHGTHDLFALNHHLAVAEQSKRDFNAQQVVVSTRWNPTPEQLQTLEELYRRGTRTPNADEIQHITAQLRRYGKIEGKNVFYWFQNHKARERQKRRRQLETVTDRKDTGGGGGVNRTGYEVEQTKNWGNPTNCTSTFSEKSVWMEGATTKAECSRGAEIGWLHFDEADMHLHQQQQHHNTTTIRNLAERNATWQMMSSPPPPPPTTTTNHLINTCYTISPTATIITSSTTSPSTVRSPSFTTSSDEGGGPYSKMFQRPQDCHVEESHETLQLFPLGSSGGDGNGGKGVETAEMGFPVTGNNHHHHHLGPRPFFEFLPLKN